MRSSRKSHTSTVVDSMLGCSPHSVAVDKCLVEKSPLTFFSMATVSQVMIEGDKNAIKNLKTAARIQESSKLMMR